MTIKVNGEVVNVEENDELEVTADVAAVEPEEDEVFEVLEAKETIGSKIRKLPWWKKAAAVVGAVAGGAYIASKFASKDDEDEEEEDNETEEDEEEE
jgi:single-stranded DNA-specific DHH superfamily exonuclease